MNLMWYVFIFRGVSKNSALRRFEMFFHYAVAYEFSICKVLMLGLYNIYRLITILFYNGGWVGRTRFGEKSELNCTFKIDYCLC